VVIRPVPSLSLAVLPGWAADLSYHSHPKPR